MTRKKSANRAFNPKTGDNVIIAMDMANAPLHDPEARSDYREAMTKFNGLTGTVMEKRGASYIVRFQLHDSSVAKASFEHNELKPPR